MNGCAPRRAVSIGGSLLLAAGVFAGGGAAQGLATRVAQERSAPACERCHGELEFMRQQASTLDRARALSVSVRALEGTGHDLPCGECHQGFSGFPHGKATTRTVECASCHEQAWTAWRSGAHARVDQGNPVGCKDCHGIHSVPTKAGLKAPATIRTMNARCLGCHEARRFRADAPHSNGVACASCHGAHDIRGHARGGSRLAAQSQAATCGGCHREQAEAWKGDVHGRAVLGGGPSKAAEDGEPRRPPTCTSCHGGHDMVHPKQVAEGGGPAGGCTRCHEKYADTFADSYHGQATKLGSTLAAGCAGCHTAHSILPADSPRSSVAKANLVATCRQCHPKATASFTAFQPHADLHDRAKNPLLFWTYRFMTILLTGTLSFFGLHTALWLARTLRSNRAHVGERK